MTIREVQRGKWGDWRKEIPKRYGITLFDPKRHGRIPMLWTTRCSSKKPANGRQRGTPAQMYVGSQNQRFYEWAKDNGIYTATLSDKLGLVWEDETFSSYDQHPSGLTDLQKREMGNIIRKKALQKKRPVILFYNNSPLMSIPYFEMLYYSGLKVYYATKLPSFDHTVQVWKRPHQGRTSTGRQSVKRTTSASPKRSVAKPRARSGSVSAKV